MTRTKTRTTAALCAALVGSALLAGCGSGGDQRPDAAPGNSGVPHGYVEGAEEQAEQQSRLVLADAGSGAVHVLDLITGDVTKLKRGTKARALHTDGRFAYLDTPDGTRVLDSGAWTVDHGDHVHYYRAGIRDLGMIGGAAPEHVHADQALTALSPAEGATRLFDREKLEGGSVGRARTLDSGATGPVVPYAEHLLAAGAGDDRDRVRVLDREGTEVASLDEPCAKVLGEAVTRRGVVLGCADGALLVREEKGKFSAEKIAYDGEVDAQNRATGFRHRAGSTTLVSPSGADAVWVLDVTDRSWTRIETGPLAAANTAGEGADLLALGKDGALTSWDIDSGKQTARTKLLAGRATDAATIEVDTGRAYVNDPGARKVYEIDYNDRLRLARAFPLSLTPTHMVETGR
ncbi:hypothetical protein ACPCDX_16430 [Streptomyces koyangensis]|uniref:hypothetical protein n=1 Tax=Streptomyces koyangensis TaxID=188770 RepID=UPI003C2CF5BA